MSNKPSEEAKKQFKGKLWIGHLYGVYHFDGNLFHPRMIFVMVVGALEEIMHFHGLSESWPDIAFICNSIAVYCVVLQVLTRLLSRFVRPEEDNIQTTLKALLTFYEREEQNDDHRAILAASLKVSKLILDAYLTINFAIFCVPNPTAWIVTWYTGKFVLTSPIYLPFVDPFTLSGYIFTSTLIVFYTMLLYFTVMTADVLFIFFIYQCIPIVDIFIMKLKAFGRKLLEVKTEKKYEVRQMEPSTSNGVVKVKTQQQLDYEKTERIMKVEQHLVVLIEEFNSYNGYIRTTINLLEFSIFTSMVLNSMAIAMSFVVAFKYSKAIGGAMVVFISSQVLVPCLIGTMITRQKEKLLNEMFAFPWYELTLSKQKMFLQFIHLVQNSNELKIPYIGILNMERFTDIVNGAYSYLMYLLKFVKMQ